ncbi:MAG TPA: energy transducer TonB [Gammaproteobacteria bacterium]|nr:energy transducer TonB [Gammaproteobacteria bacterium]
MVLLNVYPHTPLLPWTETEHDRRFRRILIVCLLLAAIIGGIVPFLPAPEVKQQELQQVAPRLAKLILQKKQQPRPKPVVPKKKVEKKKAEKKKPKKKKAKTPKPDQIARARKKAQSSGLLALQDELADLRDSFDVAALQNYSPQRNKGKTASQPAPAQTAAVLSAAAGKGSRGIDTRNLSRSTGGQALAARRQSKVESTLARAERAPVERPGYKAARSPEEIELVFQKNKGAIYSLYNRALRKDPGLQGKVLLELTIAPDGRVIRARIISSELKAPKLEKRLLSRIKLFRFAARDVDTVTVTYPIDFLPS